jgi:hypothetical protein
VRGRTIVMSILLAMSSAAGVLAHAGARLSDEQIRELVVQESLRSYPGNCPCPYNVDRAGRQCGQRSAWSRRGGYAPICFTREVADEQVRRYRERGG